MIVNRHIATQEPYNGLSPNVLNVPVQWVGSPKASGTASVFTTAAQFTSTVNSMGYSFAPGTNVDVPRNAVVLLSPNTGSAGLYSAGTVELHGRDIYGNARSESFGVTALNSASDPGVGSVNFAILDTISVRGLVFHTASSSARSAVTFRVGLGQKIGLPVPLVSTNGVYRVVQGAVVQLTFAGATSSNNEYTIVTGDYYLGGVSLSDAHNAASLLQIEYNMAGRLVPFGGY
jgi:hypothetical protein